MQHDTIIYNSVSYNMSLFEQAIGWLAPPLCVGCGIEGQSLCELCATSEILPFGERCWSCGSLSLRCRTCRRCRRHGPPRHMWITTDYQGLAARLMSDFKFGHNRAAGRAVAALMGETFLGYNREVADYLVIPIPTATSRVRARGFDHSVLLAKAIAADLGFRMSCSLIRHGQSRQIGSGRQARLAQAAGNFSVKQPNSIKGRHILLIDDVVTTGATIREAAKILRADGAVSVDALVFARRL